MKFTNMFKPINIGVVTVPNRFVVPPMGNNFANTDGSMSDRSAAYYEARAKGGFGLITIESTVVYKEAKGGPRKPCLFSDEVVPSFKRVADACHAYGAKVSIQLQHAGPEGNSKLTGYPLKAASAIAPSAGREIPEAMPTEEVYRLIECYGDAARRVAVALDEPVDLLRGHGFGDLAPGAGGDGGGGLQGVAGELAVALGAGVLELDADLRTVGVAGVGHALEARDDLVGEEAGLARAALGLLVDDGALDGDEAEAALGAGLVIGGGAVAHAAVGVGEVVAHGRDDKAVRHRHDADIDGLKHIRELHSFSLLPGAQAKNLSMTSSAGISWPV